MAGPATLGHHNTLSSPSSSSSSIPNSTPSASSASIFGGAHPPASVFAATVAAPSIPTAAAPTASTPTASQQQTALPSAVTSSNLAAHGAGAAMPASVASSSNNTYIMPNSPVKNRSSTDGYRPKVIRTLGQRPACLVNASVTYCGNNQIYAFGGFDQYTDEVYNHVLRLDLVSQQWSLVDNYGDIPGVRMGHTATLYQGDKLLVFGGENEHRTYLSDLIVFDLKTAHWTQPAVTGPIPKGRARHAAVLHEDKLFIIGGITGHDSYVLDDICYLDLKTFCWSRSWRFVGRFDHSAYVWGDRVWVFGGLSEDMDKVSDLWWLDLKGSPAFQSPPQIGSLYDRNSLIGSSGSVGGGSTAGHGESGSRGSPRPGYALTQSSAVGSTGYAANSRTAQVNIPSIQIKSYAPTAPGSISALKFRSGPNIPNQGSGIHFHIYSSGMLLDFVTPAPTVTSRECSLSTLDLATLRWQRLAEGREIFKTGYRWHYCTMNEDGTKAWLLGCPTDPSTIELGPNGGLEEYLSDIMEIDLRRYGFLGNAPPDALGGLAMGGLGSMTAPPSRVRHADPPSLGLARWPHFARLWSSQMAEFHTKKMHIPEPYSVVRAFLFYLYTDRIDPAPPEDTMGTGRLSRGGKRGRSPGDSASAHNSRYQNHQNHQNNHNNQNSHQYNAPVTADLSDVAGLLVMSNIYNIPHLRLLCVNRLSKELDVDHACIIWHCASLANEPWLRKRAAGFCLTHWGRIVRSPGFLRLPRTAIVELSQEIDTEGRVIGGDELDMFGSALEVAGGRYSDTGSVLSRRKESVSSSHASQPGESEMDEEDDDGMDMN
ncbi:kelch repeat protein [Ophiostoma piceae UAMH 11346]|uniref:Kelch repeat protein n=1 Tax=Ophiostoma piceae (strain UAMH 11346) TaxID=1262450 RepID=S3D846_OPHP1|nr:kelch repeat protein [Ophiostoma piceae UAMH 11346]